VSAIWSFITGLFSALPKMIDILGEVFTALNNFITQKQKEAVDRELADALQKTKQTHDTSGLDHLFDPNKPDSK